MITKLREKKEVNIWWWHQAIVAQTTFISYYFFFRQRRQWRLSSSCLSRCTPGPRYFQSYQMKRTSQITMICIYTNHSVSRCHQLTRSACGLEPTWCLSTPSTMLRSCSRRTASRFVHHVDIVNDGTSILYLCLEVFQQALFCRLNKTLLKLPGILITWEIRWPSLR